MAKGKGKGKGESSAEQSEERKLMGIWESKFGGKGGKKGAKGKKGGKKGKLPSGLAAFEFKKGAKKSAKRARK